MNATSPGTPANIVPETVSGLVISLLFWLNMLLATVLFAAVGLSPKLIEKLRLQDEFSATQLRLVQLEQQNEQLDRVVDAIRNDKEFAAEMTRIEFDAVRHDEEIIPVNSDLWLSPRDIGHPGKKAFVPQVWYRHFLVPFAENDSFRMSLLGTAAALVVISFTWFQTSVGPREPVTPGARRSIWRALKTRYVRCD